MFIVIINRYSAHENSVWLRGTYGTYEEAHEALVLEQARCIHELGFEPEFSRIDAFSFVCLNECLSDTFRGHIFNTDYLVGHVDDDMTDYQICMLEQVGADADEYFESRMR
jgi:hypothetical protein